MIAKCSTERAIKIQQKVGNALYEMLGQMAYDKITVRDLCIRAELPRRSFYRYFENKKDVLDYVLMDMMQECMLYSMEMLPETNDIEDIFRLFFTYWKEQKVQWLYILRENHLEMVMIQMFQQWLFEERRLRYVKRGVTEEQLKTALTFAMGGLMMTLFQWAEDGFRAEAQDLARYVSGILVRLLYPDAPIGKIPYLGK